MNDSTTPGPMCADPDMARTWMTALYGDLPGYISICSPADNYAGRRFTTDAQGIEAAVKRVVHLDTLKPKGIYAQVTTLNVMPTEGRGGEGHAHAMRGVWTDIDIGTIGHKPSPDGLPNPPHIEDVDRLLNESGLPEPTGIVLSGGGAYAWWWFDEPQIIGDHNRDTLKNLSTSWQRILGAAARRLGWSYGEGVGNLDRLLRLPGTVNRKEGLERACVIGESSGEMFALDKLLALAADLAPAPIAKATPRAPRAVFPAQHGAVGPFDVLPEVATWADILEPLGWTFVGTDGAGEKWLRPGDPSSDYSARANVGGHPVLVVHSESAGLPSGGGQKLTMGRVLAHLHYGGDESAAASDLRRAAARHPHAGPARDLPAHVVDGIARRCNVKEYRPRPAGEDRASYDALVAPEPDEPADDPDPPPDDSRSQPGLLPEEFYAARPELRQIRKAGHSRNRSGDVALYSTLARLSGMIPHELRADTGVADYVSLNLFVALVGASGTGKSSGVQVGKRLMNPPPAMDFRDGLPIGSGEGIAEVFMGTVEQPTGEFHKNGRLKGDPIMVSVRAQVRHNAFFYVDEGKTLTRLMNDRSGSTLGETIRSAAVGQTLGQTNASKDNSRYIPGGSYSMGMLVGFQPETAAPLFEDTAEGTPQRFLWGVVSDPSIPDEPCEWPGELTAWRVAIAKVVGPTLVTFDKEITTELRRVDLANARGERPAEDVGPLDSHAPVMKIKVASLLAVLSGRLHVTVQDWALAEMVWKASCAARDWVIRYAERQRRTEAEKRTQARILEEVRVAQAKTAAEEARDDKAVERIAKRIAGFAHADGAMTRSSIRKKTAGRDKKHLADAIAYAAMWGWIVEKDDRLAPGPSRPG